MLPARLPLTISTTVSKMALGPAQDSLVVEGEAVVVEVGEALDQVAVVVEGENSVRLIVFEARNARAAAERICHLRKARRYADLQVNVAYLGKTGAKVY